jgi:hypothetical protein
MRPLFLAVLASLLVARAALPGTLRSIAEQASGIPELTVPETLPTPSPTPWGRTPEQAAEEERRKQEESNLLWTTVLLVLAAPYALPVIAAGDDGTVQGSHPPGGGPPRALQAQGMASAGWQGAVRDGSAGLRVAWQRLEAEGAWMRMQERFDSGGRDQLNQYQFNLLYRFVSTSRWRGRSGLGVGLLSPLNQGGVLFGGLNFVYALEYQRGQAILRVREQVGGLGPLLATSSRLSLGWQWGYLEVFGGYEYRDYSGIGLGGPLAGALGTF